MNDALRALPSVDLLLRQITPDEQISPTVAAWICRRVVTQARERILSGVEAGDVAQQARTMIQNLIDRRLRPVINATGVALHTNLGRAPLSDEAIAAVVEAARATPVEYDVALGKRAGRAPVAPTLAAALCDAEDAIVVNNNAGALLLILAALAKDKEVVVSRGELVEIGGEFRLPDVMEAAGARLREVGTTNRTRAPDYRGACGDDTAMILKVHPSNFHIVGFAEETSIASLSEVAREANVPLVFDIGSGLLTPTEGFFADEPDARSAIAAGADLVCFSGDKLLGGPQAGIVAGRAALIEALRRHPIARAVRADKLTLAALEATLWAHARGEPTPVQRMLDMDVEQVRARSLALAARLPGATVIDGTSVAGGGSTPSRDVPTALVRLPGEPIATAKRLRGLDPPVVARIDDGAAVLDLRTVDPSDDDLLAQIPR